MTCDICGKEITIEDLQESNNMSFTINSPFKNLDEKYKQIWVRGNNIESIYIVVHKSCLTKLMNQFTSEKKRMNAKVTKVFIGKYQGIVTAKIYFDLADGTSQATSHKNLGDKYLSEFVDSICHVFEVENIFDIVNKPCIICGTDTHIYSVSNFMKPKTYTF